MMNQIVSLPVAADYHHHLSSSQDARSRQTSAALAAVTRSSDYIRDHAGSVYNYPDQQRFDVGAVVPHQHAAETSYHGPLLADHAPGSVEGANIPTSLAALNYSLATTYHTALQNHNTGLGAGSYSSAAAPSSYGAPGSFASSLAGGHTMRISSMTSDHGGPPEAALPSTRAPTLLDGNPHLSTPTHDPSQRSTYATGIPDKHAHAHIASPRSRRHHEAAVPKTPSYSAVEQTPRTIYSPMSISPPGVGSASAALYGHHGSYGGQSSMGNPGESTNIPPFEYQKMYGELWGGSAENKKIGVAIDCRIEKGFFKSQDGSYTCYRRNYFSVQCQYTLTPLLVDEPLFIHHDGKMDQVKALAMTLSAAVDGANGKNIELVQYTPKRDAGDKGHVGMKKLLPTYTGNARGSGLHDGGFTAHGLYHHGLPLGQRGPLLPFQTLDSGSSSSSGGQDTPPATGTTTTPTSTNGYGLTFERIQFKSATANNGKRRAQQQYYHLSVELWADVRASSTDAPKWVKVAVRTSEPVVVRGRSPSHYRNEGVAPHHHHHGHHGGAAGSSVGGGGVASAAAAAAAVAGLGGNYTYSTAGSVGGHHGYGLSSRSSLSHGAHLVGSGTYAAASGGHDMSPGSSTSSLHQSASDEESAAPTAAGLGLSSSHGHEQFGEQLQRSGTYEYFPAPLYSHQPQGQQHQQGTYEGGSAYAKSDSDLTRIDGHQHGGHQQQQHAAGSSYGCAPRVAKTSWPTSRGIYSRVANGY